MNLIYAALLLHSAKKEVKEETLKKVAEATGDKIEDAQVKAVIAALDGVNIDEVIEKAAMPVAAAPVAAPAAGGAEASAEPEESEEDKEKKAESAAEGLGALFG
ncbi:50S ribosomal protein P1 [Candidatus Aenigmatarchaeota archaeon]